MLDEQDEWRDVPGVPDYRVTRDGRVAHRSRKTGKWSEVSTWVNPRGLRSFYVRKTAGFNRLSSQSTVVNFIGLAFLGPAPVGRSYKKFDPSGPDTLENTVLTNRGRPKRLDGRTQALVRHEYDTTDTNASRLARKYGVSRTTMQRVLDSSE